MLKRLRRLFKADVTLRFYDEGDKTIIEHDLKSINPMTSSNAEVRAFIFLQDLRFDDSVEIRTRGVVMAYYGMEVKRSFLIILESDDRQKAETLADETGYLDGYNAGVEILDTYKTIEEARKAYEYNEIKCELYEENGRIYLEN